jgi:hypothetical protein
MLEVSVRVCRVFSPVGVMYRQILTDQIGCKTTEVPIGALCRTRRSGVMCSRSVSAGQKLPTVVWSDTREPGHYRRRRLERVVEHGEVRESPPFPHRENLVADRLHRADPEIGRREDLLDAQLGYELAESLGRAGRIVSQDDSLDERLKFDVSSGRGGAHERDPFIDCLGREAGCLVSEAIGFRPASAREPDGVGTLCRYT